MPKSKPRRRKKTAPSPSVRPTANSMWNARAQAGETAAVRLWGEATEMKETGIRTADREEAAAKEAVRKERKDRRAQTAKEAARREARAVREGTRTARAMRPAAAMARAITVLQAAAVLVLAGAYLLCCFVTIRPRAGD